MDKYSVNDDARASAELPRVKPAVTRSTLPFPTMSDDEAYNRAYPNAVPDGLQTDGSQPCYVGKEDKETHDAQGHSTGDVIRHNSKVAHPGFAAVQGKIEGEGYSKKAAGAILANASRKASPAAKKANPKLNKV